MEHPYILTISVFLTNDKVPIPRDKHLLLSRVSPPWLASTNMETSIACLGAHTMNAQDLYFLTLASPNIIEVFSHVPWRPGVCICVDQVVRSRIRVMRITWENVYKIWHSALNMVGTYYSFILTLLLWYGPNCMLKEDSLCSHSQYWSASDPGTSASSSTLKLSFVLPVPEQSQHFILCYSHSSQPESSLESSSRTRTKLPWQDLPLCLPLLTVHHHPSLIRGCCFTFQ